MRTPMTLVEHRTHTVLDSPVGPLTLVAVDGTLAGLYMHRQRHRPPAEAFGELETEPLHEPFAQAASQLGSCSVGRLTPFDLSLLLTGTPFQRRVWTALRDIPYVETISYGQLADRIG